MKFLRLVFKNVFRKKTRTLLTMGSIVLVLVLTVVLTSLLATLERENSEGKGGTRIFVQHASGLGYFLPLSHRQKIEPIPGVLAVTPEVWFGGTYIDQRPQNFFGQLSTDPETWKTIFDDFSIDPAQLTAWQSQRDSFIAGQQLIERYHWKIGDRIQLMGSYIPPSADNTQSDRRRSIGAASVEGDGKDRADRAFVQERHRHLKLEAESVEDRPAAGSGQARARRSCPAARGSASSG